MAYNDFMMGSMGFGPQAFETEEERRKRLEQEANRETQTQTVKTYADGSQEHITKTQVDAPVAPDQVFQRQVQVESGGRHYAPNGQILTSPKGAVGVAQVMPDTAANPGFGIKPITPEELSTPEGNQAFGLRYKQGMLNAFGGDQEKATAAYNAGPGRVQQAIKLADERGGSWKDYIPKETQNYLQKVLGGALNAVVPSAQAAEPAVPGRQPARTTLPQSYVNLANSAGPAVPYQAPGDQTTPAAVPQAPAVPGQPTIQTDDQGNQLITTATGQTYAVGPDGKPLANRGVDLGQAGFGSKFITAQKSPDQLALLSTDQTVSPFERQLAKDMFVENYQTAKKGQEVGNYLKEAVETGNFNTLIKQSKQDPSFGDWLKYMFFKANGFTDAANKQADKLGLNDTWLQTSVDGKQVAVRFGTDGTAKSGIDDKGNALNQAQLDRLHGMGGAGVGKPDYVGGSVINDKLGIGGRIVSRGGRTMVEAGGVLYPFTTEWRQNTVGTDLKLAANKALIEIEGKSTGEQLSWIKKWNAEHPDARVPEDVSGIAILRQWAGTGQPAAGAPTTTTTGGGTTTTQPPANPTVEKAKEIGRTEIVKAAADVVRNEANIITSLEKAQDNIKILESGKTNFGTIISGMIPGERAVGEFFRTDDSIRTSNVMAYIDLISAGNSKMLGVNPTDKDLQFVTKNVPNETWPDQKVADWIRTSERAQRRSIEIARKQIETGGRYEAPLPKEEAPLGTKENPVKL